MPVVSADIRYVDKVAMADATLTVVDAPAGKVRWSPAAGDTVLADIGYFARVVVTGGTAPGTYPSQGSAYISLDP